jgi:hypothetical protein
MGALSRVINEVYWFACLISDLRGFFEGCLIRVVNPVYKNNVCL